MLTGCFRHQLCRFTPAYEGASNAQSAEIVFIIVSWSILVVCHFVDGIL